MRKHIAHYIKSNPNNLLIISGATLILLAIPFTVFLATTQQNLVNQPKAAGTFDAECAGNLDPAGKSQCGANRTFCDTWTGGYCEDYRSKQTTTEVAYPSPTDPVSFNCMDTTNDGYLPQMLSDTLPFPCAFTKYEHFMTRMESGSFGIAMLRFHQPVDIPATGLRHIHLEADTKSLTRNYFRIMFSPELTKRDSDDRRGDAIYPKTFIQAWVRHGGINTMLCRTTICDGNPDYPMSGGAAFGSDTGWQLTSGPDNVRVPIDIYMNQTSFKMLINGVLVTDETVQTGEVRGGDGFEEFAPLGFDKAYLYLSQSSYNPCKDGTCDVPSQITHWDNVAFDGPVLPKNSLTPAGMQDVVWNSYDVTGCTVKGYPAVKSTNHVTSYTWQTWVARMPIQAVTPNDVSCTLGVGGARNTTKESFEVVSQAVNTSGDTTNPAVSITAPTSGSTVSGSVNLAANATDASGINLVEFYVDNAKVGTATSAPYSFSWDSTKVANGTKTLSAKAYDTVGNMGTSATVSVTVSNAVPPPPPPSNSTTIDFNDMSAHQGHAFTVGEYPTGVANWGSTSQWYLSYPFVGFNTPNITFNGSSITQATFSFVTPKVLLSIDATNGGPDSTVTISCSGSITKTQVVPSQATVKISTGWTNTCSSVTLGSSNGWDTNFDNIVFSNGSTTTPPSTPPPSTPPPPTSGKLGDVNNDNSVNIVDISKIIDKWGATNKPAEDVNQDGIVNILDISIAIDHWG